MPYESVTDLPTSVTNNIPSKRGKELFMEVVNGQLEAGKSETVSFASAWAALQNAGFEQNDLGRWIKKGSPTASAVHVEGTNLDDDDEKRRKQVEKAEYQGREVELNKPFRLPSGSTKKFGVYVKDGDKVKRVRFGDPNMEIRRDDPDARSNFRARHSCDTATDKTSARYWSCRMWDADATVSELTKAESEIEKRIISDDQFTEQGEAIARSVDLDLDGNIHVHEVNGQAVYMPGSSHEEYLARIDESITTNGHDDDDKDGGGNMLERAIRAIIETVTSKSVAKVSYPVVKLDQDQRIVWGWASVITEKGEPVIDQQGDIISAETMTKAANDFMLSLRTAKAMHEGEKVGEVIHSFPITNELAKSLGVKTEREGWIIAMKVHDDKVWELVKSGEYKAFSIGGKAVRNAV
jgi:cation transport regulator ChaB